MGDSDEKEEKGDYGDVLHRCLYLVPSSVSRPSMWAIKLS
jgi:hypothetical protein